ncbi:MAG: hypothetical protein R3272_12470 [Candidatus Promineifilaceae bacterium]|nr:hypothetical protein [Candidatus Promineifilaceae bacterium]
MYGTILKMKLSPQGVKNMSDYYGEIYPEEDEEGGRQLPQGALCAIDFQLDDEPDTFIHIAIFESREAYWANAESPEQNERFEKAVAMLQPAGEPEWNDGAVVNVIRARGVDLNERLAQDETAPVTLVDETERV